MSSSDELIDCETVLEKFPGKGGWTYAPLPPTVSSSGRYFGLLPVTGFIDAYELPGRAQLMPLGGGRLFLPVKAEIRRHIGKQAGDTVRLRLFAVAERPAVEAADFRECLADSAAALRCYDALPPAEQAAWLRWLNAAPSEELQTARALAAAEALAAGQRLP